MKNAQPEGLTAFRLLFTWKKKLSDAVARKFVEVKPAGSIPPPAAGTGIEVRLRNRQQQRANARPQNLADRLYLKNLHLQKELVQLKRLYYRPRAGRLHSRQEMAQVQLEFALERERNPIHPKRQHE